MHRRAPLYPTVLLAAALAAAACGGPAAPAGTPAPAAPATAAPAPTAAPPVAGPLPAGWQNDAVCYQVFVRSFYDSDGDGIGDLNGLIQKLDYINDGKPETRTDLGATCIYMMPIMAAPSYHGYDTTDYYAVNPQYGTNDDFRRLVAEAHRRGVAVVLDLVLNHTSNQHPWFQAALNDPNSPYRDWYIFSPTDPGYRGPFNGNVVWHKSPVRDEYYYGLFSAEQPDLNYRTPAVTAEARKISAFWLAQMGADGFRLDAIKHLVEDGQVQQDTPETHAWLREYNAWLKGAAPNALTIGEIFDAGPTLLASYYPDQLDMYFNFGMADGIRRAATIGRAGAFTQAAQAAEAGIPAQRAAPFITNHDQNRAMSYFGDVDKAKVAATALLTLPGLPFVYYGEEIGMRGEKPDPNIRTPMQWTGDARGFTSGTPWEPLQPDAAQVNVAAQDGDAGSLLNHYRRLIQLHTAHPALAHGDYTPLESGNRSVAAFVRQAPEETALVVINFGPAAADGVTLAAAKTGLASGAYALEPLLGEAAAGPLSVGAGGAISGAALPSIPARTGLVFRLSPRP